MRCFTWGTKSLWVLGLLTASCKNDSSWYALTRTRAISFQGWWEECCKMQAIVSMPRTSTSYITWDLSTWASLVDWQRQKSTIFVRGATSYWARILRTVSCFQTICMYIYIYKYVCVSFGCWGYVFVGLMWMWGMVFMCCPILAGDGVMNGLRGEQRRWVKVILIQ